MKKILFALLLILIIGCSGETATKKKSSEPADINHANDEMNGQFPKDVNQQESLIESDMYSMEELKDFYNKKYDELQITYDMKISSAEPVTQMSMYVKGEKARTDTVMGGMVGSTYMIEGKMTSCSQMGGQWTCFTMSPDENTKEDTIDSEEFFSQYYGSDGFKVEKLQPKQIVGVLASCYRVTYQKQTQETCVSDEGISLYMKYHDMEMSAKSYSTSVDDSVFELPKGAQEMDMDAMLRGLGK